MTLSQDINHFKKKRKKKKDPENSNLTYIDLKGGKAPKRLTESRC